MHRNHLCPIQTVTLCGWRFPVHLCGKFKAQKKKPVTPAVDDCRWILLLSPAAPLTHGQCVLSTK